MLIYLEPREQKIINQCNKFYDEYKECIQFLTHGRLDLKKRAYFYIFVGVNMPVRHLSRALCMD